MSLGSEFVAPAMNGGANHEWRGQIMNGGAIMSGGAMKATPKMGFSPNP